MRWRSEIGECCVAVFLQSVTCRLWSEPRATSGHSLDLTGCRATVLPSDSLVIFSCWCGIFSKMPGYSGIISSPASHVLQIFHLHPRREESGLTPGTGVWLVTWLEFLHCGFFFLALWVSLSHTFPCRLSHRWCLSPPSLSVSTPLPGCSQLCGYEFWIPGGKEEENGSLGECLASSFLWTGVSQAAWQAGAPSTNRSSRICSDSIRSLIIRKHPQNYSQKSCAVARIYKCSDHKCSHGAEVKVK